MDIKTLDIIRDIVFLIWVCLGLAFNIASQDAVWSAAYGFGLLVAIASVSEHFIK